MAPRLKGLWIRVDVASPRDPRNHALAERLGIHHMQAYGHITAVSCGVAENAPDGNIADVPDSTLEAWAGWTSRARKAERFAAVYRSLFADAEGQLPDYLEGQGKLIERAAIERERYHRRQARKLAETPRSRRGDSVATERNGTEHNDNTTTSPPGVVEGEGKEAQDVKRASSHTRAVSHSHTSSSPDTLGAWVEPTLTFLRGVGRSTILAADAREVAVGLVSQGVTAEDLEHAARAMHAEAGERYPQMGVSHLVKQYHRYGGAAARLRRADEVMAFWTLCKREGFSCSANRPKWPDTAARLAVDGRIIDADFRAAVGAVHPWEVASLPAERVLEEISRRLGTLPTGVVAVAAAAYAAEASSFGPVSRADGEAAPAPTWRGPAPTLAETMWTPRAQRERETDSARMGGGLGLDNPLLEVEVEWVGEWDERDDGA